jgi:hypothetical protein
MQRMPQRLTSTFHAHHDLTISGMHVDLSQGSCLEVAVMSGPPADIRTLADRVTAQRGVRHANLHLIPGEATERHATARKAPPLRPTGTVAAASLTTMRAPAAQKIDTHLIEYREGLQPGLCPALPPLCPRNRDRAA